MNIIYKIKQFFINHRIKTKKSTSPKINGDVECNMLYVNNYISISNTYNNRYDIFSNIIILFTYSEYNKDDLDSFNHLLNILNMRRLYKYNNGLHYYIISGNASDYSWLLTNLILNSKYENNKFLLELRKIIFTLPCNGFDKLFILNEDYSFSQFFNYNTKEYDYNNYYKDDIKFFNKELLLDKSNNSAFTDLELMSLCNLYYIDNNDDMINIKEFNNNILIKNDYTIYKIPILKISDIIQYKLYCYTNNLSNSLFEIDNDIYIKLFNLAFDDDYTNLNLYTVFNILNTDENQYSDIDEILDNL